ncbi:MAG TPA: DNA mismatch repair protein MutS, partial [Victivallales bacterium]|nr:DNA mismatch repair protein MutS [Victivallales bacterium]
PELKEMENKIIGAEEKAKSLEIEIFTKLKEKILFQIDKLLSAAEIIAQLDVIASFAQCAIKNNYCKPIITTERILEIKDGRHPVLDVKMTKERFVPNDSYLDDKDNRIIIITGPNMAGKSTYIRQVALLTIMAQIGSFIPALSAKIAIMDRIFSRVGASDDISRGQSTFMVEMTETANILNNATSESLIILDEIGRGTSTFDGISIAWAVAEYLHDNKRAKPLTLFATHFHELTELSITCKGVKNYNVAVKEYGEQIIFLRKIMPGTADKSYGVHVAKIAGLPQEIIERAFEILENLEQNALGREGKPNLAIRTKTRKLSSQSKIEELTLFDWIRQNQT